MANKNDKEKEHLDDELYEKYSIIVPKEKRGTRYSLVINTLLLLFLKPKSIFIVTSATLIN